uniref:WAP domain-containing protein n=1 Tax=Gouania willdenowi TaxID=441366 RepID=A0A8C5DJJ3_GOUWI
MRFFIPQINQERALVSCFTLILLFVMIGENVTMTMIALEKRSAATLAVDKDQIYKCHVLYCSVFVEKQGLFFFSSKKHFLLIHILHLSDKQGTCPRELLHIDSSRCHDWKKCDNDYDCPGEEKCCNTRCGQRCGNLAPQTGDL